VAGTWNGRADRPARHRKELLFLLLALLFLTLLLPLLLLALLFLTLLLLALPALPLPGLLLFLPLLVLTLVSHMCFLSPYDGSSANWERSDWH
jgi:hypothetical protein